MIHSYGLEPDLADDMATWALAATSPKKAEQVVPGWEPEPPLLSDRQFTFGAGDRQLDVFLKILPGDWYITEFLPRLEEWCTALYQDKTLDMFKLSQSDPVGFMLDVFGKIIRRPKNDRTKISFYEFAAETFSTEATAISARFFAVCPPDQQIGSIRRLVETNAANFHRLWAELPMLARQQLTLLYLTSIESIQKLNQSVISAISQMIMASPSSPTSGGHADTGLSAFLPLLTDASEITSDS